MADTVKLVLVSFTVIIGWLQHNNASPKGAMAPIAVTARHTPGPVTAIPDVTNGRQWPGSWFVIPPDDVLRKGLFFEVTLGAISGIASEEGSPGVHALLGTRYQPGDLDRTDVTRALWRSVDLRLSKRDGSIANIQVGRPLWWFDETGARVGEFVDLAMHEVGIEGVAEVLSIGPFDADSREGNSESHLVIGRIEHENAIVLDLVFNDDRERPLGVTANHPVFSEDRGTWIPAGELGVGEQVRTIEGTATLTARSQRPGRHKVYNVEVHRSHSYHVSQFGILAHNTGIGCDVGPSVRSIHDRYVRYVRPGARERVFDTPWTSSTGLGSRRFDDFSGGIGFEGNTTPWSSMTQEQLARKLDQVGSDYALLRENPTVRRIIWFGTEELPTTGLGGQLREALKLSGIEYWVVPCP